MPDCSRSPARNEREEWEFLTESPGRGASLKKFFLGGQIVGSALGLCSYPSHGCPSPGAQPWARGAVAAGSFSIDTPSAARQSPYTWGPLNGTRGLLLLVYPQPPAPSCWALISPDPELDRRDNRSLRISP